MEKLNHLLAVIAPASALMAISSAHGATIAHYIDGADYNDASTPTVTGFVSQLGVTAGNITFSGLNGGTGGPVRPAFGPTFPSAGNGTNWYFNNTQNTPVNPVSTANYFTFTLTGNGTQQFDLTNISFDWLAAASSTAATQTSNVGFRIFILTDKSSGLYVAANSAVSSSVNFAPSTVTQLTSQLIDLSTESTFKGINSAEIRIALSDSTAAGAGLSDGALGQAFSNIKVNAVAAVPEPSTYALTGLLGLGVALMVVRRRRQK